MKEIIWNNVLKTIYWFSFYFSVVIIKQLYLKIYIWMKMNAEKMSSYLAWANSELDE